MAIKASDIKKLRDATGAGMMDAKKALEEAGGDQDKAVEMLRKKGQAKAAKRAQRSTEAGLVEAYIHMSRVGAMVEVRCETDFVARTDDFKAFVHDVAMHTAAAGPRYLTPEDVPVEVINREKAVYAGDIEGKPDDIAEKILEGKLAKFYEAVCLYEQPFIKDQDKSIRDYQTELVAKLGENISIARFSRMELGSDE